MTLINTKIQNYREKSNLDKNETRPSQYGALDLFVTESDSPTGILSPELKAKAFESIGTTLQTAVIHYDGGVTISNTRSVTIADSENTSQMVSFTFSTLSWGYTMVPSLYHNNEIGYDKDWNTKFEKYLFAAAASLEASAIAALEAAKTQVFTDPLIYDTTGNAINAAWKNREDVIGDINPMMSANDYFGQIHVLGNGGIESMIRKMSEKGLYNEVNKTLEYSDKILHFSRFLANDEGKFATAYAVEGGQLGILFRVEREALYNRKSRTGHEWGTSTLPIINIPVGTYYYESVGDFNAIAGSSSADMTRDMKEHFGYSVDACFVTAHNSSPTTIASPYMKIEVARETVSDYPNMIIANPATNPVLMASVPTTTAVPTTTTTVAPTTTTTVPPTTTTTVG
jgi:hypothetical protein